MHGINYFVVIYMDGKIRTIKSILVTIRNVFIGSGDGYYSSLLNSCGRTTPLWPFVFFFFFPKHHSCMCPACLAGNFPYTNKLLWSFDQIVWSNYCREEVLIIYHFAVSASFSYSSSKLSRCFICHNDTLLWWLPSKITKDEGLHPPY